MQHLQAQHILDQLSHKGQRTQWGQLAWSGCEHLTMLAIATDTSPMGHKANTSSSSLFYTICKASSLQSHCMEHQVKCGIAVHHKCPWHKMQGQGTRASSLQMGFYGLTH